MDTYNLDMSPELIIFQLGCNEDSDDNVELVTKMEQLVTLTKSKFPWASISVSSGIPRREREKKMLMLSVRVSNYGGPSRKFHVFSCMTTVTCSSGEDLQEESLTTTNT